jgi:hypothetical protein
MIITNMSSLFVCHIEICQTPVCLVALLVQLKSSQAGGGALN